MFRLLSSTMPINEDFALDGVSGTATSSAGRFGITVSKGLTTPVLADAFGIASSTGTIKALAGISVLLKKGYCTTRWRG